MLFAWAFQVVLFFVKLPFYLLPPSTFLPLPDAALGAVSTLGGYTHWLLYLLGPTAGAAFTLDIQWMIPILIFAYLWNLLKGAAFSAIGILRGVKVA